MKNTFLLTFIMIPFFIACSNDDSEKVDITFSPESPRVKFIVGKVETGIDDSTKLPVYKDVPAPWFRFNAIIKNGSDKNLVIETLTLKMAGLTSTQGVVTVQSTVTAESYIGPDSNLPEVIESVPAGNTSNPTFDIYVSGLSTAVSSGVYNVEVHAQGWFGTLDNPTSVFSQKYFFTTR